MNYIILVFKSKYGEILPMLWGSEFITARIGDKIDLFGKGELWELIEEIER